MWRSDERYRPQPPSRPYQDVRSRMQTVPYEGTDYRHRTADATVGRRLNHHDGRSASPPRATYLPLRRYPHHLYLHAKSSTQSPLPPLLLLLRPACGIKLAAGGSKEVRKDTHVGPVLAQRAPSEGPRSTAALRPTWVPFLERKNKLRRSIRGDLPCSRNARLPKALARGNGTSRRASGWAG